MNEVAIYVRVSTEEQAKKNLSIPNQIYTLENYCKNKNLNIYKIYRDEGISGAISFKERPGLKALTDDAKFNRFNLILVYDINRLGRSENLFEFYDFLYYKGISVGDTSTIYDYNDINKKLHRNVETVFAIWDRDKIRKMTIDGKRERVRQGKLFLGYPTPYGYIKHDRNFKIVKEEANVIRKIFDLYLNGNGCIKIANYLNKNKYPTQHINKNRRPSAKYWRDSRIRKILRNPIYKGEYIHFKNSIYNEPVIIKIPAIIDKITYEKAKKMSDQNKLFSKRNSKREYKYKGLIICKNDNLSWHGEYDCRLNKKFYMCNGRRFKNCNSGRIYEKELDKNIWEYIKEMILNPETLEEDIKANLNSANDDIDFTEIKRLKKEREKLKNKMDKIIDLYQDDLIDKQEY